MSAPFPQEDDISLTAGGPLLDGPRHPRRALLGVVAAGSVLAVAGVLVLSFAGKYRDTSDRAT